MLSKSIENQPLAQDERPEHIPAKRLPGAQLSPSLHQQHCAEEY